MQSFGWYHFSAGGSSELYFLGALGRLDDQSFSLQWFERVVLVEPLGRDYLPESPWKNVVPEFKGLQKSPQFYLLISGRGLGLGIYPEQVGRPADGHDSL